MPATDSVLSRKMTQGGVARSPLPDTELIGEIFARMVEDRLRPLVKCAISAMPLDIRVVKLMTAVEDISVPSMLGLVEVEGASTQGLMCIDTDLAYHLIDLTLGGDPATAPIPTTRTFTSIDMALCKLHLDALLDAFGSALADINGKPFKKRMTIGDQRQNISQLRFAPDYVDVLVFNLALDIGEAARTGNFSLLMPLATLDTIRASVRDATDGQEDKAERPDDLWRVQMRRAAATSPVQIDAVLHRSLMTVAEIQKLCPGQVIDIPVTAPDDIELTMRQPGGKSSVIASGRLGAYKTSKVVKLAQSIDPRVAQHVKSAI